MRLPIALGLGWPDRVPGAAPPCDWSTAATWTFEPLDDDAFPAVRLARSAGARGGDRAGGLQRRERGVRRGVPDGPAGLPRDPRRGRARARGAGTRSAPIRRTQEPAHAGRRPCGAVGAYASPRRYILKESAMTALGIVGFVVILLVCVDDLTSAGHFALRQAVRDEGHGLLRRVRAHRLVDASRRDRVRHQGDPCRWLREDRRDDRARGDRARATSPARSTSSRPAGARVVLAAGSFMHFVIASSCLRPAHPDRCLASERRPDRRPWRTSRSAPPTRSTAPAPTPSAPSPAAAAGLQPGDVILAVDGSRSRPGPRHKPRSARRAPAPRRSPRRATAPRRP